MKKIIAISGSTRQNSSNQKLLELFAGQTVNIFSVEIYNGIDKLPHFNPDLDNETPPEEVAHFRNLIDKADAVVICTPEYVFSIPGSLKNCLEWCVYTTVFSNKPLGIITASASGEKGHEELQIIMKVLGTEFNVSTTLLIQGVKGKISTEGIIHVPTKNTFDEFIQNFICFIKAQ